MASGIRITDEVWEQLIALGYRNAGRAFVPLFLAVALGFLLLAHDGAGTGLVPWGVGTCTAVALRFLLLRRLRDTVRLSPRTKRAVAIGLNFCVGAAFGSVLVFFPEAGLFERAMLTVLLIGVSSGVISGNLGYPPLFLALTLPMLGSLSVGWIANPGAPVDSVLATSIGLAIGLVTLTQSLMAREVFDVFVLAIESSSALERQTVQLAEQAERLSSALEDAEAEKRRAESSSDSKTRFIAAASHDLRQPVHVLSLYGAALGKAELDARTRGVADGITRAVRSLSSQLETLLDLSKLDGGRVEPEIRPIELSALTRSLTEELGTLADERGIALVDTVREPVHVLSDRAMLSRMIRNLCGNAIKFTREGGVTLSVEVDDDTVALSVVDTGIGIDATEREKVFEEFYQVSNAGRDRRLGAGLGLTIVDRLARVLDHEVELRANPGGGTRVDVIMPRASAEGGTGASPDDGTDESLPVLPADLHVHLVDDDVAVRRSMRAMLESLGIDVTDTASTAATLECLRDRVPSAVLIDLRLRDGDSGLATIDALARSHPAVPLALVTGESHVEPSLAERYPDLPVLRKPVSEPVLREVLGSMVGRRVRAGRA